jgi:hypothetical protein
MLTLDVAPTYLEELFDAGLLIPLGEDGLYARSGALENVLTAVDIMVVRLGADQDVEIIRLPPAMSRKIFEATGYMQLPAACGDRALFLRQ